MSLLVLPNELLFHIVGYLRDQRQVFAIARSCRHFYFLLRKYLLQHNIRYSKGSALLWAAKMDRRNLVRRLLRLGAAVNTRGDPLRAGTPLHVAAKAGHFGMIELLLKKGADPEIGGHKGSKPLLLALWARHEEIAIFLFGKMSDPNSQIAGDAGYTPLHAACHQRLPKSARMFLQSGAYVNARTSAGSTPLHLALRHKTLDESEDAVRSCTLELVMILLEFGSDRDRTAYILGAQHPDPQVRDIFRPNEDSSTQKASFIRIGRPWSVESSPPADCIFSPTPADLSHSLNGESAEANRKDDFAVIAESLLDDNEFPMLEPLRSLQAKHLSTGAWNPSKVNELRETWRRNESTDAEISSASPPGEPFPKLIGRQSPHPLDSAAQLSWRKLKSSHTPPAMEKTYVMSTLELQVPRSQVLKIKKKKRWQPLQLS